jgi:hypothetical protein
MTIADILSMRGLPREPWERVTARQIIEARIGRKLPPAKEMRADERIAVKSLAQALIWNVCPQCKCRPCQCGRGEGGRND